MSPTDSALVERATRLQQAGRFAEAEALWRHLKAVSPEDASVHLNLGLVFAETGRETEAVAFFERAISLAPDSPAAYANLGVVRQRLGQLEEAVVCYRYALARKPDLLQLQNNLAGALQELGLIDEALGIYRYINANTDDPVLAANLLTSLNLAPGSLEESLAAGKDWASRFAGPPPPRPVVPRAAGERLRVGYVGGEGLRRHTLALTWLPLFESHDPARVELFAYSDLLENREDDVSARFKKVAHWRQSRSLDAGGLSDLIRRDRIHILVDGIGFAAGSRLLAFARRPAPVQVLFPPMSTTGMPTMDYLVADDMLIQAGNESHFQEKIWRLPCAFLYSPAETLPEEAPPPSQGRDFITFGSFSRFAKIGPALIAAWARILRQVPNSRLMIKSGSVVTPDMTARYESLFAGHGIAADRIRTVGRIHGDHEHYRRLADIDIALDTFPHGGVLTICDALALGIPVVTLPGSRPLERYGASLLSAVGFSEGITDSLDAYVARAVALAGDPSRLLRLRRELRRQTHLSPLMDAPRFARSLEDAYEAMWQAQTSG